MNAERKQQQDDAARAVDRARNLFLNAWSAWVTTIPPAQKVEAEIASTITAMRGIAFVLMPAPTTGLPVERRATNAS